MKLFQNISLEKKIIGISSILIAVIFLFGYLFVYQPNQKQNDIKMELQCKEIAESLYKKTKERDNNIDASIFTQHGFNRKLNTCIYVEEITWQEDDSHYFLFTVKDSIRNQLLLSGYNSGTYQKGIYKNHREDGLEITVDEYKKLREELLDK